MAVRRQTTEERLIQLEGSPLNLLVDVKTICETLHVLLVERGVLTDAEYLATYDELAVTLKRGLMDEFAKVHDATAVRILQQLP
jgi:hypothetical protein